MGQIALILRLLENNLRSAKQAHAHALGSIQANTDGTHSNAHALAAASVSMAHAQGRIEAYEEVLACLATLEDKP